MPTPPRRELARLIARGVGMAEIGRRFGVSKGVARRWLEEAGLLEQALTSSRPGPAQPGLPEGTVVYCELEAARVFRTLQPADRPVALQATLRVRRRGQLTGEDLVVRVLFTPEEAQRLGAFLHTFGRQAVGVGAR